MKVVNLTPHAIHVYRPDVPDHATEEQLAAGLLVSIPASGGQARLAVERLGAEDPVEVEGVEILVYGVRFGTLEGLPEPRDGVVYMVALLAALAARDRSDLRIADRQVRNTAGTVVGCRAFGRCH